jgi:hypothetical protein
MRARYGLTPLRVASSRLAAHERREGLAQHAPPVGGVSRGRARMKAGDACVSLQAPRQLRWQRSRRRVARWSPSFRRGRAKEARAWTSRRSRYPEAATGRIDPASSAGPLRRSGRLSVHDRGNNNIAGSLEKPGAHVKREHLATPLGMSPRPSRGRPTVTSPPQGRRRCLTERLSGQLLLHCPRRLAAPARFKGFSRAFIDPQRLEGAHETMRVGSVLFRTTTSIHGLANCNAASLRSIGPECRTARNQVMPSSR